MDGHIEATKKMLRGVAHYDPPINKEYGCPLYGYDAKDIKGRACCHWWTFIDSFSNDWHGKFNTYPHPDTVKKARSYWMRYSMTGYEAFVTITQRAASDHGR